MDVVHEDENFDNLWFIMFIYCVFQLSKKKDYLTNKFYLFFFFQAWLKLKTLAAASGCIVFFLIFTIYINNLNREVSPD